MGTEHKLPTINKPVDDFIASISLFLKGARGSNRGELQKWLADDNKIVRKGHAALKKEQEISTIMQPRSTQKLNSFFYIPRITCSNGTKKPVDLLKLVSNEGDSSALISGRLGQGKSMLLRYLQFLALNSGQSIPLFLEFRRIKDQEDIQSAALNKLNALGFDCSKKLFSFLLDNGYVSFFLDGFDETAFDKRDSIISSVLDLINKVPPNRVFITSRFNTEIEQLAGMKTYEIEPLNAEDHPRFINKLIKNNDEAKEIIKKIDEAKAFDASVLDTPLLLTWFVMVYKVRRKIPKTKIGFYEELFKTILSRHDGLKLSFDRPSKSGLSDSEIEQVLHAFCYLTSKDNNKYFEHKDITDYIQRALNINKMSDVKADDYLFDLTNITCLIVKDGLTYNFIHSTIQSYFSACFIQETTESNAKIFYSKADNEWIAWADELSFLFHLDSYRFNKFMVLPSISKLTEKSQAKIMKGESVESVSDEAIKNIYSNSWLVFDAESGNIIYKGAVYMPAHSYTCHLVFNDAHYKVCETDKRLSQYFSTLFARDPNLKLLAVEMAKMHQSDDVKRFPVSLLKFLSSVSKTQHFIESIEDYSVDALNKTMNAAVSAIRAEENKEGLF